MSDHIHQSATEQLIFTDPNTQSHFIHQAAFGEPWQSTRHLSRPGVDGRTESEAE